jgi:hypothetical protein
MDYSSNLPPEKKFEPKRKSATMDDDGINDSDNINKTSGNTRMMNEGVESVGGIRDKDKSDDISGHDDDDNDDVVAVDNDIGNDDDDNASVLYSSSSVSSSCDGSSILSNDSNDDDDDDDDDDDVPEQGHERPTLSERQVLNMERNSRFLSNLHEKYKDKIGSSLPIDAKSKATDVVNDDGHDHGDDEDDNGNDINIGMEMKLSHRLFKSFPSIESEDTTISPQTRKIKLIKDLNKRYPHRQVEIRQLLSVLNSSMCVTQHLVGSSSSSTGHTQVHVPAPIFVAGPRGCGKTSIVCDVVEVVQKLSSSASSSRMATRLQHTSKRGGRGVFAFREDSDSSLSSHIVKAAYIDCTILEPSTIERLVYDTYRQLRPSKSSMLSGLKRRKKNKKRSHHQHQHQSSSMTMTKGFTHHYKNQQKRARCIDDSKIEPSSSYSKHKQDDDDKGRRIFSPALASKATTQTSVSFEKENNEPDRADDEEETVSQTRVLRPSRSVTAAKQQQQQQQQQSLRSSSRRSTVASSFRSNVRKNGLSGGSSNNRKTGSSTGRGNSNKYQTITKTTTKISNNDDDDKDDKVETSHSAVMSLGRSLQQYYGIKRDNAEEDIGSTNSKRTLQQNMSSSSAILILDCAEELLSLSPSSSSSSKNKRRIGSSSSSASGSKTTNYLAELLLLPKIMKLDLTIIVISTFSTLDKTRTCCVLSRKRGYRAWIG